MAGEPTVYCVVCKSQTPLPPQGVPKVQCVGCGRVLSLQRAPGTYERR